MTIGTSISPSVASQSTSYGTGDKKTPQTIRRQGSTMGQILISPDWLICEKNTHIAYSPDPSDCTAYPARAFGTGPNAVGAIADFITGYLGVTDTMVDNGGTIQGTPGVGDTVKCTMFFACAEKESTLMPASVALTGMMVGPYTNPETGMLDDCAVRLVADPALAIGTVVQPNVDAQSLMCKKEDGTWEKTGVTGTCVQYIFGDPKNFGSRGPLPV